MVVYRIVFHCFGWENAHGSHPAAQVTAIRRARTRTEALAGIATLNVPAGTERGHAHFYPEWKVSDIRIVRNPSHTRNATTALTVVGFRAND